MCTQVEMEIHERAMEYVREMGEESKRSSLKKRLVVRLRKDGYDASLCRSSWVATTQHPGGNVVSESPLLCPSNVGYKAVPCI